MKDLIFERKAQMSVELAALLPILIVMVLMAYSLMRYVELCAQFDQVALDAIVSQGVSPPGEQTMEHAQREVKTCIENAMGNEDAYEVEVRAETVGRFGGSGNMSVIPCLTRFTCTLRVKPWPSHFSIAGINFSPPGVLIHERSLVVDRYRPGVVV